jgi:hypothetical protein
MPTHLYCLLPPGSSVVPPADIRVLNARVAQAWAGEAGEGRLSRDARDVARATIAHDRIVGLALAQGTTPMPASLADPYDDDASMLADIAAHSVLIESAFRAIAGMVEMTTIVALNEATPPAEGPGRGRAYLEQLRSGPARAASIGDRVADAMGKLFVDARRRGDGNRVALSHLIPRSAEAGYRAAADALAGDGYRIVVDGPRAPYSFALFSPHRGIESGLWIGGTILAT